jgi:hypothetical protein
MSTPCGSAQAHHNDSLYDEAEPNDLPPKTQKAQEPIVARCASCGYLFLNT